MRFEALRETSSLSLVDSRSNIMSISHGMCRVEFLVLYKISGVLALEIQGKVRVSTVHKTHDCFSSVLPASLKTRPITNKSCHVHQ